MKLNSLKYILVVICLNLACSADANSQKETAKEPAAQNANKPQNETKNENNSKTETKAELKPDAALEKQFAEIAAAAKGKVGVAAVVLETGDAASFNAESRFPMQSVYKLPIAMAAMKRVEEGKLSLTQKVRVEKSDFVRQGMRSPIRDENPNGTEMTVEQLMKYAVSESDGTASDVLFNLVGGADAMKKYLAELGVTEIAAVNSEKEIGSDWETQYRNYATPAAAVQLLRAFHEKRGFSEANHKILRQMTIETPTGMKRLKGLLPKDAIVAHKTGTSGTREGVTAATNDIGVITLPNGRHLAIAVFVSDSPTDEKTREETIARIAKAAWDKWEK